MFSNITASRFAQRFAQEAHKTHPTHYTLASHLKTPVNATVFSICVQADKLTWRNLRHTKLFAVEPQVDKLWKPPLMCTWFHE